MKRIVMIGTHPDTMGGISSVINVYRDSGLFDRFPVAYIATHRDGNSLAKLSILTLAMFRYLRLLVLGQVGALHIHVSSRASFWRKTLFFVPATVLGIPTILHLHGSEFAVFYEEECGPARQRWIRSVFNRATRVIVLSAAWHTWVRSISSNPHVIAIYNPVIVSTITPDWVTRKSGKVLFLGRLGKRKGTYDLLDAAARVIASGQPLNLCLGGDGEEDLARERAQVLKIADQVDFLGWVRGEEKTQHLATAMIYSLPSYHEGLPMSVLEAMAAGLPIVSTPIGGIPEAITDGVEGFLVEPGDVDALANRLARLLADSELAQQMGAAARRKVESTFSSDAILPQVEKLYAELGFAP